jgi:heptosyltransferase-3
MTPITLPAGARILVIALRRLGDVLLTTPLIRSLKRAFPDDSIDALVFAGTEGILAGNPDLADVVVMPARPRACDSVALLRRLWRRYDLAIATQTGDRPIAFAWAAGRRSAGPIGASGSAAAVKRLALSRSCVTDPRDHRVRDVLRLADALGIPAVTEIVCPHGPVQPHLIPRQPYAVVHAAPMFQYKRWTVDGWRRLAEALSARGLMTIATGGPADRDYLDEVWDGSDVVRRDGTLTWPEISALIGAARVYVGPDTAVTHLAAATGCRTIALYGPTNPRLWGPWPIGGLDKPWAAAGSVQHRANVWLVQNPLPCLPCQQEGCLRRLDSYSQCLDELSPAQVLVAVDQALAMGRAA